MSPAGRMVADMSRFHPWRALRALTHIDLSWAPMADRLGETDGKSIIRLHPHQSQVQRRCTLAHELAHIELEHVDGASLLEEHAARMLAARWLIPLPRLLDALAWTEELEELADECWVDLPTLMDRLDGLTEEERAEIKALAERVERSA